MIMYVVVGTVSYSEVWLSEYVGDVRSFITYVSKCDLFLFGRWRVWGLLLFRGEAGRFLWFDREGVIVQDVVDGAYFMLVLFSM
jgi:hypothetical protein